MWLLILCLAVIGPCVVARCPPDVLVMYRMVLHTEWSEENFPKQYPEWRPPAQWSVVLGRSHNSSGVLWKLGKIASDSVKMFVETGKAEMLIREGADQKRGILTEFFAPPITKGVGSTETKFFVDASHSKVSMICRIVPSPDWFIGVDSFDLCRDGRWMDAVTLNLGPLDGGTDSGYTFTSPKWATEPRSNIVPIRSRTPDHPAGSFFYPELDRLPRIAKARFFKTKEFFVSKKIYSKNSLMVNSDAPFTTRASIVSPLNELKKYVAQQKGKLRKEKKSIRPEVGAFRSKVTSTTKSKARSSLIHHQNRPKPCRVSEWSEWGRCSNTCGFGEQVRNRKVTHYSLRGGRPCPALQESKWCRSNETCRNETVLFFRWQ
ncbi:spondin-2-like [Uloborus diversus]|uniref:spondin-2-like n=1 Tax=Uloborus diversus TaxID=327109 RepID=UPI0024090756|nr:spondin-2-like [Uloborus diversus]